LCTNQVRELALNDSYLHNDYGTCEHMKSLPETFMQELS